jgi:hypothetical protein
MNPTESLIRWVHLSVGKFFINPLGEAMTYELRVVYDDHDTLEIWIPQFESEIPTPGEEGLYSYFFCARKKGAKRAFDSLLIDGFSKVYVNALKDVKRKEPPAEKENYDAPDLDLYQVSLSRILEEVYQKYARYKRYMRVTETALVSE